MSQADQKFLDHLERLWEPPDFSALFASVTKRKPHTVKKGTILFNEGDPTNRIYYIKEGFAKAYRLSEEGRETMNYIVGPGYVFGFRSLLSKDDEAQYAAEAITDLTVVTMSHEEYLSSVANNPEHLIGLVHAYAARLTYMEKKLEGFVYSSTTARIAIFLSDCVRRFGIRGKKGITFPFTLTHQRIADFVGAFRETVTLALHRLVEEKIISVERGNVIVHDEKRLHNYSELRKVK